jgi:hypothetical protein
MATAKNRIARSVAPKSVFAEAQPLVDSTVDYLQGDLLFLDSGLIKPVTADADGATILGIAPQTIVDGKPKAVYSGTAVDAAQAIEAIAGPVYGVIAKLKLKSGDVFAAGDLVYATAVDAQTVSSAGTNPVGVFQGPGVTAVSGSEGLVLLGAVINGVLQF